jgi:hypothetical protein
MSDRRARGRRRTSGPIAPSFPPPNPPLVPPGADETHTVPSLSAASPDKNHEFALARYRYILEQINSLNDNVHKFLAIYQALSTALSSAIVAIFIGYRNWKIEPPVARKGVICLMGMETLVSLFSMLLIIIGVLAWLDYRTEECELTDRFAHRGFRKPPRLGNFIRWYETYVLLFILTATILMWVFSLVFILPEVK